MKLICDDGIPMDVRKGFYVLNMKIIDKKKRSHELKYIADYNLGYVGWETKKIFVKKRRENIGMVWIYKMEVVPVWFWKDVRIKVYNPYKDINFLGMSPTYFPPEKDISK